MLVTVVIPCYNSSETIERVVEMVLQEFEERPDYTCDFVLVNDYSKDQTFAVIRKLAQKYNFVKGINLARNFGQHNALMAALNYADGDYILGMDDDLQTHPSQIFKLLDKIQEGYELVYGRYEKKRNSFLKNLTSKFNEVSSRILLGRPKEIVSSNFWVITKMLRNEVIKYTNYNPYLDGIFYRTTQNIANVTVEHHKRAVGTSNYTLRKLLHLWLAYWNYSVIPLRISVYLGTLFAAGGFIGAIVTFIRKMVHPDMQIGWASIMCSMFCFFGIILLILGVIGEYIGKIMLSVNNTPQFVVSEALNVSKDVVDQGEKE